MPVVALTSGAPICVGESGVQNHVDSGRGKSELGDVGQICGL
jgi:hypothetical protein